MLVSALALALMQKYFNNKCLLRVLIRWHCILEIQSQISEKVIENFMRSVKASCRGIVGRVAAY